MDVFGKKRTEFFQILQRKVCTLSSLSNEEAVCFVSNSVVLREFWDERELHDRKLFEDFSNLALANLCVAFMDVACQVHAMDADRGRSIDFAAAKQFGRVKGENGAIAIVVSEIAESIFNKKIKFPDIDFPENLIDMALKEFGEVKVRLDSGVMTTMSSLIAQKPSSRGHISISNEISEANFINKSIEYQESSKENFGGKNFSGMRSLYQLARENIFSDPIFLKLSEEDQKYLRKIHEENVLMPVSNRALGHLPGRRRFDWGEVIAVFFVILMVYAFFFGLPG